MEHPTPWRAVIVSGDAIILDADGILVETVYSTGGRGLRNAASLATRIVTAVNQKEST